jgi:hypothetical protein
VRQYQLPAGSPGQKPPITSLNANGRDAELSKYRYDLFVDFPVSPFDEGACDPIIRGGNAISMLHVNRLSFEEPFGSLGSTVDKDRSWLVRRPRRETTGKALHKERVADVIVIDPDDVE